MTNDCVGTTTFAMLEKLVSPGVILTSVAATSFLCNLYISVVILHTEQTEGRENDPAARG